MKMVINFYSHETAPYPAIHIALNTGTVEGEEASVKAYIRCISSTSSVTKSSLNRATCKAKVLTIYIMFI